MQTLILLVTTSLIAAIKGNPLASPVRFTDSIRPKCVAADDLVCPRDDITFWLYTKSTQATPTKLDARSLGRAPWVDGPLKFIIHGYSVNKDTAVNAVLRPAYFSAGEYNIISMDWSPLCRQDCYTQAVKNVPTVAKCVADFFNAVTKARKFSEVHLLGHSMGAHVAAWASTQIPGLPRLTKFDVAHPLFNSTNSKNGTAGFIDVYHTNCGINGQRRPSGDVDVYFNNNVFQPGCKCDKSCSHLRCVQYYAESIRASMKAFPCGGWQQYQDGKCKLPRAQDLVIVGEDADSKVRGSYMAFTAAQQHFLLRDNVYTNKASFNSFKKTLADGCAVAYNYNKLNKDWL